MKPTKEGPRSYTVIRFLWVSANFGTCTVESVNGTLDEGKMRKFKGECAHFSFNKGPTLTTEQVPNLKKPDDSVCTPCFSICFSFKSQQGHPSLGSVIAKQENPLKKEMRTGEGEEGPRGGGRRISHFFSISALHLSLPIPPPKWDLCHYSLKTSFLHTDLW